MINDINLLPYKNRETLAFNTKLKILRFLAIALLFLVSAASITLFLLITFSPLPKLQQSEQGYLTKLSVFHPQTAKLIIIKERLSEIDRILKERSNHDFLLSEIYSNLPTSTTIESLSLNNRKLSVVLSSSTLVDANTFLDHALTLAGNDKYINTIILDDLSQNETLGKYQLRVSMGLL